MEMHPFTVGQANLHRVLPHDDLQGLKITNARNLLLPADSYFFQKLCDGRKWQIKFSVGILMVWLSYLLTYLQGSSYNTCIYPISKNSCTHYTLNFPLLLLAFTCKCIYCSGCCWKVKNNNSFYS